MCIKICLAKSKFKNKWQFVGKHFKKILNHTSCSLLDEGVVVNLGIFKALDAIGTFGGISTFVVEDRTILVVVIVIGESLKLLLRLVRGGFGLLELLVSSEVGRFAAFPKMGEKICKKFRELNYDITTTYLRM